MKNNEKLWKEPLDPRFPTETEKKQNTTFQACIESLRVQNSQGTNELRDLIVTEIGDLLNDWSVAFVKSKVLFCSSDFLC